MMKPWNRKTIIISVILVILFAVVIVAFSAFYLPRGGVEITGTVVDNDYNNYLSRGNLVRIGDKLYYNYVRTGLAYGLIEISESGSERVYWNGPQFMLYRPTHDLRKVDDNLVMAYYDQILYFSPNTKELETYTPFSTIPGMTIEFQTVNEKLVYRSASDLDDLEVNTLSDLCIYNSGLKEIVAAANISAFYVVGNDVYYYVSESYDIGEFRKYNLIDKTDISIRKNYRYSFVFDFMIEGDCLIFTAKNEIQDNANISVYKIDLNKPTQPLETIYAGKANADGYPDVRAYNVYNGTVYIATHSGLQAYDTATNECRTLYNRPVKECYIVDDLWVYFVNDNAELWRIPQIGGTAEKVYG